MKNYKELAEQHIKTITDMIYRQGFEDGYRRCQKDLEILSELDKINEEMNAELSCDLCEFSESQFCGVCDDCKDKSRWTPKRNLTIGNQ